MTGGLPYVCCEDRRRAEVRTTATALNGIDFLEVLDAGAPEADRQRILRVHFLRDPSALAIGSQNVRIDGGDRIRSVPVDEAGLRRRACSSSASRCRATTPPTAAARRAGRRAAAPGSTRCCRRSTSRSRSSARAIFDCRRVCSCPPEPREDPAIDYLAKDYDSFRRLMLDRMALVAPEWTERNPADLEVALVELVAYAADHLSYEQDAVATEAYLGTARRRVSIRRHATLLDYPMHDGCNARVFVRVGAAEGGAVTVPAGTPLLTELDGRPVVLDPVAFAEALPEAPEVFETMHELEIRAEHDEIALYGWGERECCLPAGATRATLAGHHPHLRRGDLLVLEEVVGPRTGAPADADPTRRHVVRLVRAAGARRATSSFAEPVTEVAWGAADVLPYPFCLSARTDAEHGGRYVDGVSVARGNVVLCDHGRTIAGEDPLGAPPPPRPAPGRECERCGGASATTVPARFAPELAFGPLTHAARVARTAIVDGRRERLFFDPSVSAAEALRSELARALPVASVRDELGRRWLPQRDLLSSDAFALEFVAEPDDGGRTRLRFGDGEHGARPAQEVELFASYRVGGGARGNVGAEAIRHLVLDDPGLAGAVTAVSNPLPATGGTDPESIERVRLDAPEAFKALERAVTPEDYAAKAQLHPEVQRAQATVRWTGSWRTIYLTVDRLGARPVDAAFEAALREHLERYRMAGHDLEIDGPLFVSLELGLDVCVLPGYFRSDVAAALTGALGPRGHFDPDRLTFGQPVFLSPIIAAAAAVPGVRDVHAVRFQRQGEPSRVALDEGVLTVGRLEIARLDNDPSFPERGLLALDVRGGR